MKGLEALETIKNAPTIYVGCASDIYTRYSFECKIIEKELKALEIIKVLFNGRAKLYERNGGIQQVIDGNGNYNKATISVYILEFYVGNLHYKFHLHKDEYDLLKEVLL